MSPVFRHGRLRLYLLKLLDEAPRHGYEVIRLLQDRFMGIYAPSPGTIYPRLARLEEEGLVTHDEADGRKVYRITEKGREELRARLDDLTELEDEITASVRDIAREVTEDVRDTVRTLREELSWAAREFHTRAQQAPGGAGPAGDAGNAGTGGARASTEATGAWEAAAEEHAARAGEDEEQARRDVGRARRDAGHAQRDAGHAQRDAEQAGDQATQAMADAAQATDEARRAAAAGRTVPEGAPHEGQQAGSASRGARDRQGQGWHEEAQDWSGRRRDEREWGEWAGWTGWGGWPGAAGHGWADPDSYRDLERLAKQFSRELRSAAWQAQAVSEDALRDLRGILDETIDRIRAEVFKGKTPPGDPEDATPPAGQ
jgi:DNA-binding PadR family transcriptional regulator